MKSIVDLRLPRFSTAHAYGAANGSIAKFWLEPVRPARNVGYKPHELRRIRSIVESRKEYLLETWYGHFG